jgi:hypothetical protein
MNTIKPFGYIQITCAVLSLCAVQLCWAQSAASVAEPGDPPRWYKNDSTAQDYYMTLKKEAEAANQEAKASCRSMDKPSRAACLKQAQAQYNQDMQDAKHKSGVVDHSQ